MGKFNTLAAIFCFVLFCLPALYYGMSHDKKINLKIELVDKDLLLSPEHLKKEKNILQNGKKIKIKIFEKIKENVLERALVVQEVDKIKGMNASKRGNAASLQYLSDDSGDDGADGDDDNDEDDNSNDAASGVADEAGSEEEYDAHAASDMKVISTEESTENDVHMLRKVYQKKSDAESTTYCYMRYTFNLNLDKLSENSKSELFKGLDKSLDYMSFLPKEDQGNDTEQILDHEYKRMDKSTESNESILSSVELRNDDLTSCPNSEYVETIDDIVSCLESMSSRLAIPSSIKNKLLSERDLIKGCHDVEAGDASSTGNAFEDNAPDNNAEKTALYEILANLKDSFMMKKKVINLLRNGSTNAEDANTDRVSDKDLDEIFVDSIERTFDCYDVLKGSELLDSILSSEEEKKTLVEELPNTKEVDISNHQFGYAPGESSEENSLANGDDKDKCVVFFKGILQSEIFARDSSLSHNLIGGHFQMLNDEVQGDGLSNASASNSGGEDATYTDSFFNSSSRMPIVEYGSAKLHSAFMGDERHIDVRASERDNSKEATSNWQDNRQVFANTESFADMSTGMRNYEMDDEDEDDEDEDDEEEEEEDDDDEEEDEVEVDEEDDEEEEDENEEDEDDEEDDDDEQDDDDEDEEEEEDEEEHDEEEDDDDEYDEEPNRSSLGVKDLLGNLLKRGSNKLIDKATNKVSSVIGKKFNIDKLSKKANKMVRKIKDASKKTSKKYKKAKKGVKKSVKKAKLVSKENVNKLKKEAKNGVKNLKDIGKNGIRKIKDSTKKGGKSLKKQGKEVFDKAVHVAKDEIDKVKKETKNSIDKGEKNVKQVAKKGIQTGKNKVKKVAKEGINKAEKVAQKGINKAEKVAQKGIDKVQEAAQAGVNKAQKVMDKTQEAAQAGVNKAQKVIDKTQAAAQAGVNKAQKVIDNAQKEVEKTKKEAKSSGASSKKRTAGNGNKTNKSPNTGIKGSTVIPKEKAASKQSYNDPSGQKVSKSKKSFLSISDESSENTSNRKKIKSEIKKINKGYKKLRKMEKKVKDELKNPVPSDKKIIQEFDDFEKSNEEKKE
ncbi:hypothetical protein AK88_02406 [Plasmodium fragile]|uniref:Secreted ookinete protein n=1 Tax=Plasmodium fragile TaxID=5857 RepID=A0A0D9QME5_PLAFR|nr:uncharacterized protein AK88_02406 [Plasmodium fragile]KJP87972.1 hypothetical protein AK88_02406 [Plasmodium fragile]